MTPLSYLFVPATRTDRIAKAFEAHSDAVIVDLEDAVDASQKQSARKQVQAYFDSHRGTTQTVWLRINAVATPWFADDLALVNRHHSGIAGVMLAKTESGADLDALQTALALPLPVIALVESAKGILSLASISHHPSVTRLAFGSADLARDLGCEDAWDTLLHARMQMLLHSTCAGLEAPIDGVTFSLDDASRVTFEASRAARAGFAPSPEQVQWARRVLESGAAGSGAQRLNGEMIDKPVVERAQKIMARHQRCTAQA